ncbi:MAG: glycoside hydrolase family 15 protein, partial [Acidimicrobiales bacterium]
MQIEDYGLIGDTHTAALVGRDGSIDWLCLPRFDSGACFAALLGEREHGRWKLAAAGEDVATRRQYRASTLVLETEWTTATGTARVIDFMPPRQDSHSEVIRIVEGVEGTVDMEMDLVLRFEYGSDIPWVRKVRGGLQAIAGPNAVELTSQVPLQGRHLHTEAHFSVGEGERVPFVFCWYEAHHKAPQVDDAEIALSETVSYWEDWCAGIVPCEGEWNELVSRSLVTLKALTYHPTGGIVAAPTTSLPEAIGGVRNWDYRYCWVRDATLTLDALIDSGRRE